MDMTKDEIAKLPTPETDAALFADMEGEHLFVEFTRSLEQRLAALREVVEMWVKNDHYSQRDYAALKVSARETLAAIKE